MEFGDRSVFAITVQLDREYGGPWLFGKMCYWLMGVQVGDFDLGTSLRDVLLQMKWIVNDCGRRTNPELFALHAPELCHRLTSALYGRADESLREIALRESWARFDVRIPVDVFDRWKVFLIDGEEFSRMVICDSANMIWETQLPLGEFDRVFVACHRALDANYEAELERPQQGAGI